MLTLTLAIHDNKMSTSSRTHRFLPALLLGALLGCTHAVPDRFDPASLSEIDRTIERAVNSGLTPGGVFWLENENRIYKRAYGARALDPSPEPATLETIYDAASLTKVLATAPSIMLLIQQGRIGLDDSVSESIPEFRGDARDEVTVRHLLTHTSGLRPSLSLSEPWYGAQSGVSLAIAESPVNRPGFTFRYSDINYILLGEIVRRVSGKGLDQFARDEIFVPAGMTDTRFLPDERQTGRIAPTEKVEGAMLRGVVHDPTARRLEGVAGHAGLFTTARDVARFARMILAEGALESGRIFTPTSVRMMSTVQSPDAVSIRRGLGWDIDSLYSRPRGALFPLGSFGHTGWTGTFLWIDPGSRTFYVFLSNRVHPDGKGSVLQLQKDLGTLAAKSAGFAEPGAPTIPRRLAAERSIPASGAIVDNGIDVLVSQRYAPLRGLRVGLITNQTGRDRSGNPTIDLLRSAPSVELVALFSPEHGIRSDRDEQVSDTVDSRSGLPITSLYGARRKPDAGQLRRLDVLVFDIQDIGARFYTYISTLGLAMEAASEANIKLVVLDRVNPIGGTTVEGPPEIEKSTFTAYHPIAVRHGMTVGELAQMFKEERNLTVDLQVIPVRNWKRSQSFDELFLAWVDTSPNMRSVTAARLYPGIALLETTHLSVGRGTATPFEIIGAPYIDEMELSSALNAELVELGARFHPTTFTPSGSVFAGELCHGVRIEITRSDLPRSVELGIGIGKTLHRLYGERFGARAMNKLLLYEPAIDAMIRGDSLDQIRASWSASLEGFLARRVRFLIYE